jgi:hypothetical protein
LRHYTLIAVAEERQQFGKSTETTWKDPLWESLLKDCVILGNGIEPGGFAVEVHFMGQIPWPVRHRSIVHVSVINCALYVFALLCSALGDLGVNFHIS